MADNFLERQMEDYRSGKLTSKKTRSKKGNLHGKKVLIVGGLSEKSMSVIQYLTDNGCKVAFTYPDLTEGNKFQQKCGARFYNINPKENSQLNSMLKNLLHAWGKIDMIIAESTQCDTDLLADFWGITPLKHEQKAGFTILMHPSEIEHITIAFPAQDNDLFL